MVYHNTVVLQAPSRNWAKLLTCIKSPSLKHTSKQGCTGHIWLCFWGKWCTVENSRVRMAAWCYDGEIENWFVSWEDSDTDTDPWQVVTRECIKTVWCEWIFDSNCSWIKEGWSNYNKTCAKKGKTLPQETLDLVQGFYEDDEYTQQMPGKKYHASINGNVHKQKWLVLCNLSELYSAFRGNYPNIKIGFYKFCTLRPKWCVLARSLGTHCVCVCSTHQNAVLLADTVDWEYTNKNLIKKVVCDPANKVCLMHHCESCPRSAALKKFLDDELSHLDTDSEFHYCQWQTTDHAALTTFTTTFEYKELLIDRINNLTWHSCLAKA